MSRLEMELPLLPCPCLGPCACAWGLGHTYDPPLALGSRERRGVLLLVQEETLSP